MSIEIDEMVVHPTRHFKRPKDVLAHADISHEDKLRILESWKLDAKRLADSTEENMTGGEETDLGEVSRALTQLKGTQPVRVIQPNRGAPIGAGMTIGALLGAGAGLIAAAATATVSLPLIAQTTLAGFVIGGVAGALRRPVREPEL